ncbi:hypothetical protein [Tenacibaculum aiptasiae]|uniref:hypothetical protein n=1 Tax=Tenacibaculum aiptasiae TaxID=426481 RepID=UPI003B5C078A
MKELNHKYRLLKESNWGIAIDIDGSCLEFKEENTELNYISIHKEKGIFIDISKINHLPEIQKNILINGIKWVRDLINYPVVIKFSEVKYNFTDFQLEGLFFASAEWASITFKFKLHDYKVSFDKKENKYIFTPNPLDLCFD